MANDKYVKLIKQYSEDGGNTWYNSNPPEYKRGDLIETDSPDCGAAVLQYRWFAKGEDYYTCEGYNKYYKEWYQYSYNGEDWFDVEPEQTRTGQLIEQNSYDCDYGVEWIPVEDQYICKEYIPHPNGGIIRCNNPSDFKIFVTKVNNDNSLVVLYNGSMPSEFDIKSIIGDNIIQYLAITKKKVETFEDESITFYYDNVSIETDYDHYYPTPNGVSIGKGISVNIEDIYMKCLDITHCLLILDSSKTEYIMDPEGEFISKFRCQFCCHSSGTYVFDFSHLKPYYERGGTKEFIKFDTYGHYLEEGEGDLECTIIIYAPEGLNDESDFSLSGYNATYKVYDSEKRLLFNK